MPSDKCRNCGKDSVIEDDDQVVCTACGQVQEDATSYEQDRGLEGFGQACHSGSSYNPTFATGNYRLRERSSSRQLVTQKWTPYLNQICDRMQIKSKEMHKEAAEILASAFKMSRFKFMQSEKKRALCGSCVYVTCRRHNWPILITNLLGVTDATDSQVMLLNKELIQLLKIEINSPSVEEYVPTCLAGYGVTDKHLVKQTVSVIGLAGDLWLQMGRQVKYLVLAACCIAWQTSTPKNHKKSIPAFGRTVLKKPMSLVVKLRYKELEKILEMMVAKVPWVSTATASKPRSWKFYLDDILKYKSSILSRLESPGDDDDDDGSEDCRGPYPLAHPAFKAGERKRALEGDRDVEPECKVTKSGHLTRESMCNPELSEKDIPDSELGLYIKTPEEVEKTKELRALVEV